MFDRLTDDERRSVPVLERTIKERVGLRLNRRTLPIPEGYAQYFGNLRAKQYPNELAQLLAFLYTQRDHIHTYLEIGVELCGTFYTVDSYLRSVNPRFCRSIAVDKRRRDRGFEAYRGLYDCAFHQTRSAPGVRTQSVEPVRIAQALASRPLASTVLSDVSMSLMAP